MNVTSTLQSVLNWLRGGYPEGVPGSDRVPLLALLQQTPLTEDEVRQVIRELTDPASHALDDGAIDRDEIEEFISEVTHREADDADVRRVAGKLAAAGWPLAGVGRKD
ncbi:DUF3349 domain-containing protein [Mycolicibacterium brumae]|uniref:DUF3349 domain-containing protein n=1 Tax=Mycolicibacterium brumae TaxID=85968 RepID=A0A2G5P837_9MYCO|nr:DUF3349 domain-containing protein [Mycolicibacterium brumae]MCV7194814.1 DUF3349 domain-containing protein [Mycolicibacterium brumae]PIB74529.1 DUF3349 domain-containing protein [Mycolicibacterium brumae]RWA19767.1 hypothetical protein MBRU_16385 [Mycolicibacterium brumae DSM 44177]UWW09544.1 DUF3349 domain-containing protein [Mycolicibacterium brumae]